VVEKLHATQIMFAIPLGEPKKFKYKMAVRLSGSIPPFHIIWCDGTFK
jgi:hypothetical protein